MHELGVVLQIFDLVSEIMVEQELSRVSSVTIEVGELSGILPDFFKECWNAAGLGSQFENTQLIVEYIPARVRCVCGAEYEMQKNSRICPECGRSEYEIIDGRQFNVKQIEAC